ncbi:MAG: YdhR family protein [Acidobacteria bacterium]|nr:YdhR family protein [Acidobacteriota bacterium]
MYIQFVKFKSGLSDGEVRRLMEERAPQFRALSGLVQKYYVRDSQTGEYGGIYLWDSEESMNKFRQSELARGTPISYKVVGQPRVEVYEMVLPLRPEKQV